MSNPTVEASPIKHTVKVTEDGIEFTCHGDRTSKCHQYPDCDCEQYSVDGHEHPHVAHDECWLYDWFYQGWVCPSFECIDDHEGEFAVGMEGEITASFNDDCIEWEFKQ